MWGTGWARIPNEVLFMAKNAGGLKLVNLLHKQQALKVQWLFRIRCNLFLIML